MRPFSFIHRQTTVGVRLPAIADTLRNAPVEWVAALQQVRLQPDTTYDHTSHHTSDDQTSVVSGFSRTRGTRTVSDKVMQDIRYALRLWRRRPLFAAVAILTLALGVGANTAMFSIVNAVLLRPLPYPHADRLVSVFTKSQSFRQGLLSYQEYEAIRKQSGTVEAIGLYLSQSVNLTGATEPQRLVGSFVSGTFFDVLGLKAERGRLFSEEDSAPGTVKPVVVLSHQLWRQRYNEDASAIGRTLTVNGTPLMIVGVMETPAAMTQSPADGYFIGGVDLFLPLAQYPTPRGLRAAGGQLLGVGRLEAGVALSTANADLDVIGKRLLAADPKTQAGRELTSESAHETVAGASRPALLLLFASVGVVLLIACVNVSQLLLARAIDRQKEIALRAALGASRSAVARQLTVDVALMAVTATALGFLLGRWALAGLAWLQPPSVPIPTQVPLDGTVLLFTGGVAIVVALLCGLAPALRSSRPDITSRPAAPHGSIRSSRSRRSRDVRDPPARRVRRVDPSHSLSVRSRTTGPTRDRAPRPSCRSDSDRLRSASTWLFTPSREAALAKARWRGERPRHAPDAAAASPTASV